MGGRNYRKGSGFEYRWLEKLRKLPNFVRGERFFASKGKTDVWYILQTDKGPEYHEDQLKYGTKNYGVIPTEEFIELLNYAMDNEGKMKISLVTKMSRKPELVWPLN